MAPFANWQTQVHVDVSTCLDCKLHRLAASQILLMQSECTPAQFLHTRDVASLRNPHSLSATELLSLPLCVRLRACTSCGTKLHR